MLHKVHELLCKDHTSYFSYFTKVKGIDVGIYISFGRQGVAGDSISGHRLRLFWHVLTMMYSFAFVCIVMLE